MGRSAIDLTGQQFGNLIVLNRQGTAKDGHAIWKCQCQCQNKTICYKTSNTLKRKKGAPPSCGCISSKIISENAKKRFDNLLGKHFGKLIVVEKIGSTGQSILWRCKCQCGNENFITTSHHLKTGNTKSCGCLQSIGQYNIIQILNKNNINFIKQYIFDNFKYKQTKGIPRFDFFLPSYNRLIEFDGKQHFEKTSDLWEQGNSLEQRIKHDLQKNEWAKEHNIPLVRIPYWERDNITLDMILGNKYLVDD